MENQALDRRALLLQKALETQTGPGVYLMKDEGGVILYVGKAKNLKNRVSTYFQLLPHTQMRTEMLVQRVDHFDTILTETEAEALILECTLIKKHKPKFNVRLKDDKAYPYLKIQLSDSAPRLEWTRKVRRDGARYFGPFPSAYSARTVLRLLTEAYKLRDCSDNTFRHRTRACILYQIGHCTAPCVGKVSAEDYRVQVQEAIAVLEGKGGPLVEELRGEMHALAEAEQYEEAADVRDQLRAIEVVTATQVADEAGSHRNRDVISIARSGADAHGVVVQIRAGRIIGVRHYHLQNTEESLDGAELLFDFCAQYYWEMERKAESEHDAFDSTGASSGPPGAGMVKPPEILVAEAPADLELLEKTLGFSVTVPESEVDKQLLSVAEINAKQGLEQAKIKEGGHGFKALEDIQDKLHLEKLPSRIECYDISNIQGQDAVASRVVFMDAAPDKNLYRRYKIRTVEGSNDFAMMKEVLGRRFANVDEPLPDLVVVDGGKGQLSQAVAILEELQVQGVAVVGLAKARTESDFQAKEVKSSMERIFIPNRKNPVPLLPHTDAYKLLTHVRDEAHRFAISYHRLLRSKRSLRSDLE